VFDAVLGAAFGFEMRARADAGSSGYVGTSRDGSVGAIRLRGRHHQNPGRPRNKLSLRPRRDAARRAPSAEPSGARTVTRAMGRSSGAYLARPRAELDGTVAAGARGGPGHGRARGSRRRDGGERERHGRSPWKVPGERCVRVISRGGRPGVGIREIRPRVSRMTRRCSRRRCRRSVVSGVRSFDSALLPRPSTSDIREFLKTQNSFCSRGKKPPFPQTGTHRPIGPNKS